MCKCTILRNIYEHGDRPRTIKNAFLPMISETKRDKKYAHQSVLKYLSTDTIFDPSFLSLDSSSTMGYIKVINYPPKVYYIFTSFRQVTVKTSQFLPTYICNVGTIRRCPMKDLEGIGSRTLIWCSYVCTMYSTY